MDYCQITALVTGIANALAAKLDDNSLNLLGAILSQLGDTLETIAVQRSICAPGGSSSGESDAF